MVLTDFSQWLVSHSALINLTTSVILATATTIYVIFTIKLVRETRKLRVQEFENKQLESIYSLIREAFHELDEYERGKFKGPAAIHKYAITELGKEIINKNNPLEFDPRVDYLIERAEPIKILIEYIDGNFKQQKTLLDKILQAYLVRYQAKFEYMQKRLEKVKGTGSIKKKENIDRIEKLLSICEVITKKYKAIK